MLSYFMGCIDKVNDGGDDDDDDNNNNNEV